MVRSRTTSYLITLVLGLLQRPQLTTPGNSSEELAPEKKANLEVKFVVHTRHTHALPSLPSWVRRVRKFPGVGGFCHFARTLINLPDTFFRNKTSRGAGSSPTLNRFDAVIYTRSIQKKELPFFFCGIPLSLNLRQLMYLPPSSGTTTITAVVSLTSI